jgi:hypothetical protein
VFHSRKIKFSGGTCNSAFSVQFGFRPEKAPFKQKKGNNMSLHTPDLTKFPPRSPRVRLGGYAILPRMLDKGRATVAGKQGEYHYACPLDQQFLEFAGIDPEALKKELHKSDTEILGWIHEHAKHHHSGPEILAWTHWQENRAPNNPDGREYLNGLHKAGAPNREDIITWFDVLDMDDYVSFGGKS